MCRFHFVEPEQAGRAAKKIFENLVMTPNLLCILANSDTVLKTFVDTTDSFKTFNLSYEEQKLISLAVSQFNECPYCIALHTSGAVNSARLTHQECLEARMMTASDPRRASILTFTKQVLEYKGRVRDDILLDLKYHGVDDKTLLEIICVITTVTQANYTANAAQPEIDFLDPPDLPET